MDGGRYSISAIGMVQVSEVKFFSTHLKTLLASSTGSSLAIAGPPAAAGATPGRG
jgi:hypothetical protein